MFEMSLETPVPLRVTATSGMKRITHRLAPADRLPIRGPYRIVATPHTNLILPVGKKTPLCLALALPTVAQPLTISILTPPDVVLHL